MTPAQQAVLGAVVFFATLGIGLFVIGERGAFPFAAGMGWAVVVYLVWRWSATLD